MPNHVRNQVFAAKHVLEALRGPECAVDFNSIIPMPEILKAEESEPLVEDWAVRAVGAKIDRPFPFLGDVPPTEWSDERFEKFITYQRALREHKHASWYSWSTEHWDTKWNAYSVSEHDGHVEFDTAWSRPAPVLLALSKKFPDEEIRTKWADEDFGNNVGTATLKNGDVLEIYVPAGGSAEAEELALEIRNGGKLDEEYMYRKADGRIGWKE